MSSPGLTSESDSVGYQRVIDNSPRRLVIETLALPKNETLIENFETKTKCFLCDLEFDLNIERYWLYLTGWMPRNFDFLSLNCHCWEKITKTITKVNSWFFTNSPYVWFWSFFLEVNGGASFRWSFGPLSAWGSTGSTTILTTHPSLWKLKFWNFPEFSLTMFWHWSEIFVVLYGTRWCSVTEHFLDFLVIDILGCFGLKLSWNFIPQQVYWFCGYS